MGVIGAIAIPRLSRGSDGAGVNAFVAELNTLAGLIDRYQLESGSKIADSATGVIPPELVGYLHENAWEGQTPIGGYWDIEANDTGGIGLAVGVHFFGVPNDAAAALKVDRAMDDGDLTTGAFQRIAAKRFYLILEN